MASFTDAIPQFNPYIQQLPVEAMVTVGMEKQQRYDQGLQKIQSQIDQVAGLSLYRDSDKQQLQSKLNELGSKLKTVAAGDFSNYQLVNSVAGMAGTVMKDPTILAAVQSTQNIKNNEKLMEEARQKGELTPDNELYYTKKLSAYENSGLVDERGKPIVFGAKYEPHFDVEKFARETFNSVKPSNLSWDEVFTKDVNGKTVYSPVMLQMEKEGIFPEVVRQTIDQIFSDPRVAKQLQITGEYNYKGQDANSLKTMLIGQQDFKIAEINNEIQDLTLKKNSTQNLEEKGKIDIQINNLKDDIIPKVKSNYASLLQAADSNTEAVRGYLYENDVRGRYTSMFGYMKTKQNRVQDPQWKANFDMENEAQRRREWGADFSYRERRDQIEDKQWEIDPNYYDIFEHWAFGEINEFNNYRLTENPAKGIMCWRRGDDQYANILKGNYANLATITDVSNFRIQGNMESHDEERVVYKALTEAGQTIGNLNKALDRMPALGSVFFLVPGPKMIWHFSELGCNMSVNTCPNGLVGDCRLETKPQPQWTQNWPGMANRGKIYSDWAKMIGLRTKENLFEVGQHSFNLSTTGRPRLDVWTSNTQTSSLSYVFVLTNFSNNTYNVAGGFPFAGTWSNLMDNSTFSVTDTNMNISIEPGEFRVFGNKQSSLNSDNFSALSYISLLPNPSTDFFSVNIDSSKVFIYSMTGQLVKSFQNKTKSDVYEISDLNSGLYLVKVYDANNNEKTLKLIKQ
jgi:hypothetical protein